MKTPLHYQVSTFDCVPTCFINALSVIFHREDIPPSVVHRIHTVSYDFIGKDNEPGWGTSWWAMELLGYFIEKYRTKSFKARHKCLVADIVHLGKDNAIDACLDKGGVVLALTRLFRWSHCVLILSTDERNVYIHDPYRRVRQLKTYDGNVLLLESDGFGPNLRVSREWFDQPKPLGRFCLGPINNRLALALWPVKKENANG